MTKIALLAKIGDFLRDKDPFPKRMGKTPTGTSSEMVRGMGGGRGVENVLTQEDQADAVPTVRPPAAPVV